MRLALASALATIVAGHAGAQTVTLDPALDLRARYEHVEQEGLARDADALTLRLRPSLTAKVASWSALVEAEAVVAPIKRYNDGLNGRAGYPTVADPENIELNRAQIGYAAPGFAATAGRQRIALADERFVGTAPWRQSEQTFDAVRVNLGKPTGLSLDASYSWSVRTVNGRDGYGARPSSITGNNAFGLLSYRSSAGTLTAFGYLVDQDEVLVQSYRLSSQTYGLRLAGSFPVSQVTLGYAATWARQSNYHRNPNDYAADYWLGEISASARGLTVLGGYEILGADQGAALTSVQAPLSSAFKFNGWTGKFVTTPPDGLHDGYATVTYTLPKNDRLGSLTFNATWHDFTSDRVQRHYGTEVDLLATLRQGARAFSIRYAHYDADSFASDTDRFWLQFDWAV
jgi:hypothetical protein